MRISLINNMIALVDPCNSDLQDLKWRSVRTGGDINVRFYAIRGKISKCIVLLWNDIWADL